MRRNYHFRAALTHLTVIATIAWLPQVAGAQLPQELVELVEQALDQPMKEIDLKAPLDEALVTLGEKTGLVFQIDKTVTGLMPYGLRTSIQLSIRNLSVREGLTRVFNGLGLRMELKGDKVAVMPAPVLDRVGRRLTPAEATVLGALAGGPWSDNAIPLMFRIDPNARPREKLNAAIAESKHGTAMQRLDAATQRLGWVWRPDGDQVVIETRRDDVSRRLDRVVDLSYQRVNLDDVLVDLGKKSGVTVFFEPGSLQSVEARDRAVDLVQRVTVRQTLERICGNTGLRYEIVDEGVRILGPLGSGASGAAPAGAEFVRMTIEVRPGVFMEVVLPVKELPADLQKDFEKKVKDLFGKTVRAGG